MASEWGELLTRWTARLAVACYMARLFAGRGRSQRQQISRGIWTIGCGIFLCHVACAFHFYHNWSHQAAYEHTARQTADMLGLDWGGGLYFNYAMTLIWAADVVLWWGRGVGHETEARGLYWTVQLFFAFMMFNATIVFGPPFWKWVAAAVGAALLVAGFRRRVATRFPAGRG